MYSSLPSASKLYASNVTKSKQKSNAVNARKKRRKSKVLPANVISSGSSETHTLVSDVKNPTSIASLNYDSDTTESVTENTVRFYSPEEKSCQAPHIKLKSFPQDQCEELSQPLLNDIQNVDEANIDSCDPKVSCNTVELENEMPQNMVIAPAGIHNNSKHDDYDNYSNSDFSEEELHFKEDFEVPIIVISSSDSPDLDAEIKVDSSQISEKPVLGTDEVIPINVSPPKCHPYETINEERESEDQHESKVEGNLYIHGNAIPDIVLPPIFTSESGTIPTQTDFNQATISSYLSVENKLDSKGIDDISIKSDCCTSKNIYNEYSTETVDDSEPHFMIDDSKPSSTEECSSSISDSDVEPERITSPGTSEISGTESSIGDNKKITREVNKTTYPRSVGFGPILNVPKAACYVPPYVVNMPDITYVSSCENVVTRQKPCIKEMFLHRTQSLPDYLNYRYPKNVTFNFNALGEYCHIDQFPSSASIIKSSNCDINGKWIDNVKLSRDQTRYTVESQMPKSYESSTTSLASGSSESYRVLPPVTTKEARLRSYVVGSVRASGSLLGVEELLRYFPEKKVNVFVGTWNMNGQDAPHCIDDFLLPLGVDYLSDIYAIGVQESSQSRNEWEILMQTTLGPSHVLLTSTSLGVLHLAIFIRRDLIWFCSEPEDAHVATRPGTMVKTKGAVAISFTFFGTSFLFINSHLTAHEKKLKERLADYEKICQMIDLPKKIPLKPHYQSKDATSRFDNVFWCGDLNFRVVQSRPSVVSFVEEKLRQTMHTCDFLLQHDQLHKAMNEGMAFHGFQEGVINFVPSYKFDIGTCCFNSTKQRVPSYTDRVLYRCKKNGTICCAHYNVVSDIMTSDHKPVFAVFEVSIGPGRDNIPLAAGLFKREVYLEACRRRANALEVLSSQKSSTVCCVM